MATASPMSLDAQDPPAISAATTPRLKADWQEPHSIAPDGPCVQGLPLPAGPRA
jgi:hypothetical protein